MDIFCLYESCLVFLTFVPKETQVHSILPMRNSLWTSCLTIATDAIFGSFLWVAGPVTMYLLACNTDSWAKKFGCVINKRRYCAWKLAESANYAGSYFLGKSIKIMLQMTNYAKNYSNTICQSLSPRTLKKPRPNRVLKLKHAFLYADILGNNPLGNVNHDSQGVDYRNQTIPCPPTLPVRRRRSF